MAGEDAGRPSCFAHGRPRTRPDGSSDGLGDFARFQAAGTDVLAARRAAYEDADLLQVRVEAALRRDHRVRAAVPERGAFTADMTDLGHGAEASGPQAQRGSSSGPDRSR